MVVIVFSASGLEINGQYYVKREGYFTTENKQSIKNKLVLL